MLIPKLIRLHPDEIAYLQSLAAHHAITFTGALRMVVRGRMRRAKKIRANP
jgi:hypothetical protein